jgi:uncharacterized protein YndB with AHSA1/START domain
MGTQGPAISESATIERSIDAVWETLTNWSVAPDWMPRVTSFEGPVPIAAGDEVTFEYQDQPASAVIDEVEAPRRLVIRRTNGPVQAVFTYELRPNGEGTTVHLAADIVTAPGLGLMRRPLRRALARTDRDQLKLLKRLVESGG